MYHQTYESLLEKAYDYYRQGQFNQAQEIVVQLCHNRPLNSTLSLLIGCLHFQEHNYEAALNIFHEIIHQEGLARTSNDENLPLDNPFNHFSNQPCLSLHVRSHSLLAEAHNNLGTVYRMLGNADLAIGHYFTSFHIRPDYWDAINNIGSLYLYLGEWETAVEWYQQNHQACPYPCSYLFYSLGMVCKLGGNEHQAKICFERSYSNQASIPLIESILSIHPTPDGYNQLGILLSQQSRREEAIARAFVPGLLMEPMNVHLLTNLGSAYKELGRMEQAVERYQQAISIDPYFVIAIANLANCYKDIGIPIKAIEMYRRALAIQPHFPEAFCNLVHTLIFICDWHCHRENMEHVISIVEREHEIGAFPSVLPFHSFIYQFKNKIIKWIAESHAKKAETMADGIVVQQKNLHSDRIRIGYVSSDFGDHPLSHLMQSCFGLHCREKFHVHAIALSASDGSSYRQRIESEVETFIDCSSMTSKEIAQLISDHEIQILINLNGYTKGARTEIFAMKPSPIQVSYMGYACTMGASYIPYMITDAVATPLELADSLYTEKLVFLPFSYFMNDHKQSFKTLKPIQKQDIFPHLERDSILLANFNQLYKIDPDIFSTWMSILLQIPKAFLWLLRFPPQGEANLLAQASARGITSDRILFSNVAPKTDHIARGQIVDLFLDTPCCNAHTTAADILWSGTPMITLPLMKMSSRVGASLLFALGLSDLVAHSLEDYERKAVSLIRSSALPALKRFILAERWNAPLFDTARLVGSLEEAYRMMWMRYLSGLPPDHLYVK